MLWWFILNFLFFSNFSFPQEEIKTISQNNFSKDYDNLGVEITAPSAVVIEKKSGQILLAKQERKKRPIASITKLISALVLLDRPLDWKKQIVVPRGEKIRSRFLKPGDKFSLDDLLKIGLVGSDNLAIDVLANTSGISRQNFVNLMNKKAHELGMRDSHFVDPTGLNPNNVSTAFDVAQLAKKAFSTPRLSSVLSLPYYKAKTKKHFFTVYNTNKLLSYDLEHKYTFLLGKTGYLEEAGYCLAELTKNNKNKEVISVVLGAPRLKERFLDTKRIVYWSFENWQW